MAVNVRGAMLGCKHAIPHMLAAGGGSIVNTSSTSGQFGDLSRVAYGVSKAGVDSLTRYVATLHGKQGIRCNAIAPGPIFTPALEANIPAEQLAVFVGNLVTPYAGRPADIASMVVYLCSDEARYVTGQVINVDGGMVMHTPTFAQFTMGG
jgi:NAD(P)-dependent dehydrogenase (short-subunit alcohol dehydrogenase family)